MTQPDVSVLIPAWNCEATIGRAVDSALSQEGVSVELCICNDASTDNTEKIITDRLVNSHRMIIGSRHSSNQGQCHALNTAGVCAAGRYFIELDADDWLEQGALAKLVAALDAAPDHIGFAYGCTLYHGALGYYYQPRPFKRSDFYSTFPSLYPFMYRREAWDAGCRYHPHAEINGRALSIQDWDMALQLIEYMRYDGLALRDTHVLNYTYAESGTVGHELKANNDVLMAAFRKRWPKVTAEGI